MNHRSVRRHPSPGGAMDFSLTPDQETFRQTLRTWLKGNIPREWKHVGSSEIPRVEAYELLRTWQRSLFDAGFIGLTWPKEYGGRGLTFMEELILQEEMALAKAPPILNVLGVGMAGPTLIAYGTEDRRKAYPPKMLSGEEIWCQGYSEPNAGSDLASLGTRAVKDGEFWVINGQKVWTSFAQVADWMMLLARTDPNAPRHKGITYFLLDMKLPGVVVKPLRQITGEAEFNEVFLDNVRVHESRVLGGFKNSRWSSRARTRSSGRARTGPSTAASGSTPSSARAPTPSRAGRRRSRRTSSPSGCSACRRTSHGFRVQPGTGDAPRDRAEVPRKRVRLDVRARADGGAGGRHRRVLDEARRAGLARPGLPRGVRRQRPGLRGPHGADGGD